MAFQKKKDSILAFYETTNEALELHKQTYGKLVSKLNENVGITQTLNNNLDNFMDYSFPEFDTFKQKILSQPLEDTNIAYVYDINKNEYLTNFTLPDKKIIVKKKFECILMAQQTGNATNITAMSMRNDIFNPNLKLSNINHISYTINQSNKQSLEFWIDDYFNIYIPLLKTYLVSNYSKFPLYSFYINLDKLNLYNNHIVNNVETIMFNSHYPEDSQEFSLVNTFITSNSNYLNSEDNRNLYKTTLFSNLLKFYKYNEKQTNLEQYQTLSEKLEQLSPSASKSTISDDEDTMNDEAKIFAQSQRIRELEVINQKQLEERECLRSERIQFIESENTNKIKLNNYQSLLEELNTALHNEIDKTSIQQKEIFRLKNINLESSEIKQQLTSLQDKIKTLELELSESEMKSSKLLTLNATLIDKHTENQQKLILERQTNTKYCSEIKDLKVNIEKYDIQIKELEKQIISEKEQHIICENKTNDLIANMGKSETAIIDNDYQEILLSQLKEKNDEIKQIQQINTKLTLDIKKTKEEMKQFKLKVSSLL